MQKNKIIVLSGSNQGQRLLQLQQARHQLELLLGPALKVSGVYETAAWGREEQPAFLNQVLVFEHEIPARALLTQILQIEQGMGRSRTEKWGARTIDIDILFYGSQVIQEPDLQIPHPYLQQRRFTLEPLCEIEANFVHPVLHTTCAALLESCTDPLQVKRL